MENEYFLCEGLEESLHLLHRYDGDTKVIAGGTDLILQIEAGDDPSPALIDITRIPDLQGIAIKDDRIYIGAAITFNQLIHSSLIQRHAPHLVAAAKSIAGRQIRNVATVAGNIVNASPSADSAPALYTLDAHVHFFDEQKAQQSMPIERFMNGVKKTALPRCGLVTAISFPLRGDEWRMRFRKLGLRHSMAISVVSAAVALLVNDGIIREARLAFGAVAPTPVRSAAAEQALVGLRLEAAAGSDAPRLARSSVSPIDDFRASAAYRLQMVENILRQELRNLAKTEQ